MRLCLLRFKRFRFAEDYITERCRQRDGNEQGQRRLASTATLLHYGLGLNFFEQATLQFTLCLLEIGFGERTCATLAFEFAQLIAKDVQIGLTPVNGTGDPGCTPKRQNQNGEDDQDQQCGGEDETGHGSHFCGSSTFSRRSACCCSAVLSGESSIALLRRRR